MSKAFHPSNLIRILSLAPCLLAVPGSADNELDAVVKSFERDKEYVKPLATLFGSMTNSGWYQSAGVGKGIGFYFGVPINLTYVADADRSHKVTHVDQGCRNANQDNPSGNHDCDEVTSVSQPTILGRKGSDTLWNSDYDFGSRTLVGRRPRLFSDGLPDIAAFNWFPYLAPQLSASFYHTELKLRYLGLPLPDFTFAMPAVGIQHDLASVLPPIPLPISVSLAGNVTWMSAEWEPGGGITGKLELSGVSTFLGALVGYNILGRMEVFMEAGWERSTLETSGHLVIKGDPAAGVPDEDVRPGLELEGRNAFRAALSFAVHLGYQAVLGQSVGAQLGHNVNVLGYRFK